MSLNLIQRLLRPEFPIALGTLYPAVDRIIMLNERFVSAYREIAEKGEPGPSLPP